MTREPVSEHYRSGPLGPRVQAALQAAGRLGFALDHRWAPGHMSRYLDDQLGTILRRRLAHHLSECQECRELWESLQHLLGVLGRAAQADAREPAPPLAAVVRARLHEHA